MSLFNFTEPPPQGTSPDSRGQDWLYRLTAQLRNLVRATVQIAEGGTGKTTAQTAINALTQVQNTIPGYVLTKNVNGNADWEPLGTPGGVVTSVSTTDPALTIAPTAGDVVVTANDFVGDSGSGGVHGEVPAPAAGDAVAGKVLKADGTWGTAGTTSPLTTKGDIYTFSTINDREPVGTNGQVLSADSTQATGLKWVTPSSGSGTVTSVTATSPIVVTPSPITTTGVISHAVSGVTAATYGDTSHYPIVTFDADGHATSASNQAIPASGTTQGQEFTTPGANTFNVPAGVSSVWVTMIGGGGGGSCTIAAATGGGGGGAGELVQNLQCPVTGSGTVTVTIGAKGTGGATGQASAQPGVSGGDTSFGSTFIAKGGKGGNTNGTSGAGGGVNGSASKGVIVAGTPGTAEAPTYFGGASGGGGGNATGANGAAGGGSGGYIGGGAGSTASSQAGGGGGASTIWGLGGAGGSGGGTGNTATSTNYGSGGGGAGGHATTTVAGGDGAPGYCLVQWVA